FSAIPSAPRDLIRALRLCSDRGHPGGQEWGERSECHELNRLGSPQRRRPPAVPEIGDDSWLEHLPTAALGDELELARTASLLEAGRRRSLAPPPTSGSGVHRIAISPEG